MYLSWRAAVCDRSLRVYCFVDHISSDFKGGLYRAGTMGGSRHSKNAGTMGSEGMTYHERRSLGFGTVRERIGKVVA